MNDSVSDNYPECPHCEAKLIISPKYCSNCGIYVRKFDAIKAFSHKPEYYIVIISTVFTVLLTGIQVYMAFSTQGEIERWKEEVAAESATLAMRNSEALYKTSQVAEYVQKAAPVRWDFGRDFMVDSLANNSAQKRVKVEGKYAMQLREKCMMANIEDPQQYNDCQNTVNAFCVEQAKRDFPVPYGLTDNLDTLIFSGILVASAPGNYTVKVNDQEKSPINIGLICFKRPNLPSKELQWYWTGN